MPSVKPGDTSAVHQYFSVIVGCILAFLYGNCIGWSSTAVPQLEQGGEDLPTGVQGVDSFTSGWIGGAFCLGALVSSPTFGILADCVGRKKAAYFVGISFVLHWSCIAFGNSIIWILIGRALGGIGGAGSITVVSIYSNEVSEEQHRGTLGSFMALIYAMGIYFSYIMGAHFEFYTVIYTYLAISITFFVLWWKIPESPAYLVLKGQDGQALKSLLWLRSCSSENASKILTKIKVQQAGAVKPSTVSEFFRNKPARRGIAIAMVLMAVQTYSGIFAIHSYARTIFERASGTLDPKTSTMIYGFAMCLGGCFPLVLVDRLGRKVLLMFSCIMLTICLSIMGSYFLAMDYGMIEDEDTLLTLLPVVVLSLSVIVYYTGLGSVVYISVTELFTDENRGVAGSFISIAIWSTSFLLLQYFAPVVKLLGDYSVFYGFSAVCCFGAIFIYIFLPETKGRNSVDIAAGLIKQY